jgi:hypothetical protein
MDHTALRYAEYPMITCCKTCKKFARKRKFPYHTTDDLATIFDQHTSYDAELANMYNHIRKPVRTMSETLRFSHIVFAECPHARATCRLVKVYHKDDTGNLHGYRTFNLCPTCLKNRK